MLIVLLVASCLRAPSGIVPRPATNGEPKPFVFTPRPTCDSDEGYGDPEIAGHLGEPALTETSGIVASPTQPGVLWMHNDSGDSARIFALSTTGAALGEIALDEIEARDIEDIAAAPCPDLLAACLYLADTGDNRHERPQLFVYAVPEPDVAVDKPLPAGSRAEIVWRFPVVPSPAANIEGFIVMPDASAMIFYEKTDDDARALSYPAPWTVEQPFNLVEVARFDPPGVDVPLGHQITGADLHPSGTRLLLRTYSGAWEAVIDPASATPADVDALTFTDVFIGPLDEPQGEAIAYDAEGTGIWSVSESPAREPGQPLHHTPCSE